MVKRVSTKFLDSDSLSDCYGWEAVFPEDRPLYQQQSAEDLPDNEVEEIIQPKRRGRPKRPYLPPSSIAAQPLADELGNDSDSGKFAWE